MKNEEIGRIYFFQTWYGENGWLHNFFPAPFRYGSFGKMKGVYASAEQFLMQQKASVLGSDEVAEQIMANLDPETEKKLGRSILNYDEALWSAIRFQTVRRGIRAKFQQNPQILRFLLDTGGSEIAEVSSTDRLWGIGLDAEDPRRLDPANWEGENLLGNILKQVRRDLFDWLSVREPERIQYIDGNAILEYGEEAYFPPFADLLDMPFAEAAEVPRVGEILMPYARIAEKRRTGSCGNPEEFLEETRKRGGLSIRKMDRMIRRGENTNLPEAGFSEMIQDLYDQCRFGVIKL